MSLYDFIAGTQVKLFYTPALYPIDKDDLFVRIGGSLTNYHKSEKLPIKTLFYNYPSNFIFHDYKDSSNQVLLIKNGVFVEKKKFKYLTDDDLSLKTFDYTGRELNLNTISDYEKIHKEFVDIFNTYFKELAKAKDPHIITTRTFKEATASLIEARNEKLKHHQSKWIHKDEYNAEKEFGCFLYIFDGLSNSITPEGLEDAELNESWTVFKNKFEVFKNKNNNIEEKYINWLKVNSNDDLLIKAKSIIRDYNLRSFYYNL